MHQPAHAQKWLGHWPLAVAVSVALLLLRSWFFLAWEESYFDSDQAIVGLMAKHLAEGRALPLFFYGQEYLLAVESWWAAPFLALFGPSVASLRTALVALNLLTGLLLVRLLRMEAGLSVWASVAASSPFWMAPVLLAASLVEAQGGNIEPFLWTLVVWMVRWRPLVLGVVFALAIMNREFSAYAAPMLALVHLVEARAGRATFRGVALNWLAAAAAFLIVFTGVQLVKPYADLMGPGTAGLPVQTLGRDTITLAAYRVHWNPAELGVRFGELVTDYVPTLFGFKPFRPSTLVIASDVPVGWRPAGVLVALLGVTAAATLGLQARVVLASNRRWLFPLYLVGVGTIAVVVYALARPLSVFTMRYGLLVLYVPIGLAAMMLHHDNRRLPRLAAAAALAVFVASSITDHVRVLAHAASTPPPTPMRDVVQRLLDRRVHVAFAGYWRAYNLTYLSGERIRVASTDMERIAEYRAIADGQVDAISPGGIVVIQREPCAEGGERVGNSYLCDWK